MKRRGLSLFSLCLVTTILLSLPPAVAAPVGQFAAPTENGKIDRVDLNTREVVVGDTLYKLGNPLTVYTHRGFPTNVDALKKGVRIAFDTSEDAQGVRAVSIIWILSNK